MYTSEFKLGRNFVIRAEHNSDLIKFITDQAEKEKVSVATFAAIGALKRAKIAFYNQKTHKYNTISLDFPLEIASCIGNISTKDGKPFVHTHAVLSDREGNTKAGHLIEGKIFAGEIHLQELKGTKLERTFDKKTALSLWNIK